MFLCDLFECRHGVVLPFGTTSTHQQNWPFIARGPDWQTVTKRLEIGMCLSSSSLIVLLDAPMNANFWVGSSVRDSLGPAHKVITSMLHA